MGTFMKLWIVVNKIALELNSKYSFTSNFSVPRWQHKQWHNLPQKTQTYFTFFF